MADLFEHSNWLYEKNEDNSARYVLGEHGDNPLVCIGVNPSTAEPNILDPTLRQVRNRAVRMGFDGWIMLNLYPQRATNPNNLPKNFCYNKTLHAINTSWIRSCIYRYNVKTIWAAWGTVIKKRVYLSAMLKEICEHNIFDLEQSIDWITIGPLSKDGHPHHPLYLSKKAEIRPFNIKGYLESLK